MRTNGWMDGWMGTTKLRVTFHNFANTPKSNGTVISFEHKKQMLPKQHKRYI